MTIDNKSRDRPALVFILWVLLLVLFAVLLGLSVLLLIRSGIFGTGTITDETFKTVWAFVGVALGAAVTLVGALLTEQNNRRTANREELARENEDRLGKEAEERLQIDTVAKVLELLVQNGEYAPKAVAAGAVMTLAELRSGVVAYRILGELWKVDRVDSDTAVWLIDRLIEHGDPSRDEAVFNTALFLLIANADKLTPRPESPEPPTYFWPMSLPTKFHDLPPSTKTIVFYAVSAFLLTRDLRFWQQRGGSDSIMDLVRIGTRDDEMAEQFWILIDAMVRGGAGDAFDISHDERAHAAHRTADSESVYRGSFLREIERVGAWDTVSVGGDIVVDNPVSPSDELEDV